MRSLLAFAVAAQTLSVVYAAPSSASWLRNTKSLLSQVNSLTGNVVSNVLDVAGWVWSDHNTEAGQISFVEANGVRYEQIRLASLEDHSLRISPIKPTLCDPKVKQHNGYLDVSDGKHLFFWYFEAREKPEDKPLVLWLNGGPGPVVY
ncbi:hypothetical protein FRC17_004757, partial [Serendipita sp. 399]